MVDLDLVKRTTKYIAMANGIVSVNDARLALESDGSLTALIGSNSVYNKTHASFARKKEVNVRVISSDGGDLLIRNMPLFDEHDLKEMINQSGEFKYVHIGCITVSIEPLIHHKFLSEFGKTIKGVCIIFDSTFEVFNESIICAHKFDLSEGRADFVCYPSHCLSASDSNLSERLSVLLCMDNIRTKKGNEMMTVCIGHITTGTNTLNPSGSGAQNLRTVNVKGTADVEIKEIDGNIVKRLEAARNHGILDVIPTSGDQYIRPKRTGVKKYFLKTPKVVVRRNYDTQLSMPVNCSAIPPVIYDKPRMSMSAPNSPNLDASMRKEDEVSSSTESAYERDSRYYLRGSLIKHAIMDKKQALLGRSARYSD